MAIGTFSVKEKYGSRKLMSNKFRFTFTHVLYMQKKKVCETGKNVIEVKIICSQNDSKIVEI